MKNILLSLSSIDKENSYFIFVCKDSSLLNIDLPTNFQFIILNVSINDRLFRYLYLLFISYFNALKYKLDVFYFPTDISSLIKPKGVLYFLAVRSSKAYPVANFGNKSTVSKIKYYLSMLILKKSHKLASKVVFVSQDSLVTAGNHIKVDKTKRVVIYHGIKNNFNKNEDPNIFFNKYKLNNKYILNVSAIGWRKNIPLLIHSFNMIKDKIPHDLCIVGKPVEKKVLLEIKSIISHLGLNKRVKVILSISYEEMSPFYSNADIYITTSTLESFGHTLVESMLCNTSIIASDAPCIPEICDDAALYFESGNQEQLSERILQLINDQSLRSTLKENMVIRSKYFSWDKNAKELLALLTKS